MLWCVSHTLHENRLFQQAPGATWAGTGATALPITFQIVVGGKAHSQARQPRSCGHRPPQCPVGEAQTNNARIRPRTRDLQARRRVRTATVWCVSRSGTCPTTRPRGVGLRAGRLRTRYGRAWGHVGGVVRCQAYNAGSIHVPKAPEWTLDDSGRRYGLR